MAAINQVNPHIDHQTNQNSAVALLSSRSQIHNISNNAQNEVEYRKRITKWFEDIYNSKHGSKLLDIAAKCEKLQIIFDFDSKSISNVDVTTHDGRLGATYTSLSHHLIFVGALSETKEMEQNVKGILAHEIFHYVMDLVYENKFLPFYKNDRKSLKKFEDVCWKIEKMLKDPKAGSDVYIDDSCNEIISGVYSNYKKEAHLFELIVRPAHIYAQYDNDEDKVAELEAKYNLIFEFYEQFILPELEKFNLEEREKVREINKSMRILQDIKMLKFDFILQDNTKMLIQHQLTIIETNVPKFFLLNAINFFEGSCGKIFNAQTLFISSEIVNRKELFGSFNEVIIQNKDLTVFVDCSNGLDDQIIEILEEKQHKFVLIVSGNDNSAKLAEILNQNNLDSKVNTVNYKWDQLTPESQQNLLKHKIKFQNGTTSTIPEIIFSQADLMEPSNQEKLEELSEVIDGQLLSLLVDKSEIIVNKTSSNDENFKFLFQERSFDKHQTNNKSQKATINKLLKDELIRDVENKPYVLISDLAGTGKSWAIKNIKDVFNNKWTTLIDLKEFFKVFKSIKSEANFLNYMINFVLKDKPSYEVKIFSKLYKTGKVCMLCDGFDEIAPDCAEYVLKLFKSFEFNDGNQLWITTRDHFEVDLKKELELDTVYKLSQFTEQECIDLVAVTWILNDKITNKDVKEQDDPAKIENFQKYQELAHKLSQKVISIKTTTIGLPQFYKMIAEVFIKEKEAKENVSILQIYADYIQIQVERWTHQGGPIRTQQSIRTQRKVLNHREVHQLIALQSLFPNDPSLSKQKLEDYEWNEGEVLGCGLLYKKDESYIFVHETFREYYAADAILTAFKAQEIDENICNIFVTFMTVQKFGAIRSFLNDGIQVLVVPNLLLPKITKIVLKDDEKLFNLSNVFESNTENLGVFIIKMFQNENFDKIQKVFKTNNQMVRLIIQNVAMFTEFEDYIFNFLDASDFTILMLENLILHEVTHLLVSTTSIEDFFAKTIDKIAINQLKNILTHLDEKNRNLLFYIVQAKNEFSKKFKILIELMNKYFSNDELICFFRQSDIDNRNLLHYGIGLKNKEKLECIWNEIESHFNDISCSNQFRNFFSQLTLDKKLTPIHAAAYSDDVNYHKMIWKHLTKTFECKNELKNLLLMKDKNGNNYVHIIIYKNMDIIGFVFKMLKEYFNETDYQEIIKSKMNNGRNIFTKAITLSKDLSLHQCLWQIFKDCLNLSENTLEIFEEVDDKGYNILTLAAWSSTSEIFEFLVNELHKYFDKYKLNAFLRSMNIYKRNILQSAAAQNKSPEFHETMWNIIKKYCNLSEIIGLIRNKDIYGNNFLQLLVSKNHIHVIKLGWNEIKNSIDVHNYQEQIKICDNLIRKVSSSKDITGLENDMLSMNWLEISDENAKVSKQELIVETLFELLSFVTDENVDNHKVLWNNLVKSPEILPILINQRNSNESSYVHLLMTHNKCDVIEFTLNQLKDNLSVVKFHEILSSNGFMQRNLLQMVTRSSQSLEIFQNLWNFLKTSFNNDNDFIEFLDSRDENGDNVLTIAACFASVQIFKFIIFETSQIIVDSKFKSMLNSSDKFNQNTLQKSLKYQNGIEFHEHLWKVYNMHLSPYETLDLIIHENSYGSNLLIAVAECKSKEIKQLTWEEIKKVLILNKFECTIIQNCEDIIQKTNVSNDIKQRELDVLKLTWNNNNTKSSNCIVDCQSLSIKNLDDLWPFVVDRNTENHIILWEYLHENFKDELKLKKLMSERNQTEQTYINQLVFYNTSDVIELTFQELSKNLSATKFQEVLKLKGQYGRTLLQLAVDVKYVNIFQILWNFIENSFECTKEFTDYLGERDENGNSLINLIAIFSSSELLSFFEESLAKIPSEMYVKKLLLSQDVNGQYTIHIAALKNKSLEFQKILWRIYRKYFNSSELLEFFIHQDVCGFNIIMHSIHNTKEILLYTWSEIQQTIINTNPENKNNIKNVERCDWIVKKFLEEKSTDIFERRHLNLQWIERNTSKLSQIKDETCLPKINNIFVQTFEDLKIYIEDHNIENHELLWIYLHQRFLKRSDLKDLLLVKNKNNENYIHKILSTSNAEIIEITLKNYKIVFNEAQFNEVLRSKGFSGANLLQLVAPNSKELKTYKLLFELILNSCSSDDEFKDILLENDKSACNIFMYVSCFGTTEIFDFFISELKDKFKTKEEIINILIHCSDSGWNMLTSAVISNKSNEVHQAIWKLYKEFLDATEILKTIYNCNANQTPLLHLAIITNSAEIVEFTWNQIKQFITTKEEQIQYLSIKSHDEKFINQLECYQGEAVRLCVESIMNEYGLTFMD